MGKNQEQARDFKNKENLDLNAFIKNPIKKKNLKVSLIVVALGAM
jgi:hypothetical protein